MLSNQEQNLIDQNPNAKKKKATNLPYGRKIKINVSTLTTKITIVLWESVSIWETYNYLPLEDEKLAAEEREKVLQERQKELK